MLDRYHTLRALAGLLGYPGETYLQSAEMLYVLLGDALPEAAQSMAAFGAYAEPLDSRELEENYARTFDINPACALEVGWHLFGEEYARGMLMVRLRGELRECGIEESSELPDHITHVLALLAAMPHEEARRLAQSCVQPAVDKMHAALVKNDSPYQHVLRCLALVLEHEFGGVQPWSDGDGPGRPSATAGRGDPLRDYPSPCGPCSPADVVPMRMDYHAPPAQSPAVELTTPHLGDRHG
jgi:nitrate reductase delta subunit